MTAKELVGRVAHYVLAPIIRIALKNSRRAYVLIWHDGKVLVVKNVLGSGKWHLPGGGCHKNESFESAAVREADEEVGVQLNANSLTSLTDVPMRSKREFDFRLFSVTLAEPVSLNHDRREILETAWMLPNELNTSNAGDSTLEAVRLSVAE